MKIALLLSVLMMGFGLPISAYSLPDSNHSNFLTNANPDSIYIYVCFIEDASDEFDFEIRFAGFIGNDYSWTCEGELFVVVWDKESRHPMDTMIFNFENIRCSYFEDCHGYYFEQPTAVMDINFDGRSDVFIISDTANDRPWFYSYKCYTQTEDKKFILDDYFKGLPTAFNESDSTYMNSTLQGVSTVTDSYFKFYKDVGWKHLYSRRYESYDPEGTEVIWGPDRE